MNCNEKGRVDGAACEEKNKSLLESSTGIVPPQAKVIATREFRHELLTMISILQDTPGFEDGVRIVSTADGPDTVFVFGVETPDRTAALGLEVTVHDWRPTLNIPARILEQDLLEILSYAESMRNSVRLTLRNGRAALASAHPDGFIGEVRELYGLADKISDRVGSPVNWAPVPDDKVVSVSWWPMLPTGGNQ